MHQIQLTDHVYSLVKHRADQAGFTSVDAYVADVLTQDTTSDTENFDYLFTPERIAHLDKISAEVREGGPTYNMDEVRSYLDERRAEWIRSNDK